MCADPNCLVCAEPKSPLCADPGCWFCAALVDALIDMARTRSVTLPVENDRPVKGQRKREHHEPPFAPFYLGVTWNPHTGKWHTQAGHHYLGSFEPTEAGHEAAGQAYAAAKGLAAPVRKKAKA